jgi:DNA-binding Lrp family transcriptional regulator
MKMKNKERNKYFCVNGELVQKYGLTKGTILSRIEFWIEYNKEKNQHFYDGYYWSGYLSAKDLSKQLYISIKTIRNNINELEKSGVLIKGNYNNKIYDNTIWYRLNENDSQPLPKMGTTTQNGNNPLPKMDTTYTQNGNNPLPKMGTPIPVNHSINHSVSLTSNLENTSIEKIIDNTSSILGKNQLEKQLIEMFPMFEENELLHLLARNKIHRIDEVLDNPKNNINKKHAWNLISQYQTNK